MKIANIEFNLDALSKMTENEFKERYVGVLKADITKTSKELRKYFKKDETTPLGIKKKKRK